jgi:hypothetical protein
MQLPEACRPRGLQAKAAAGVEEAPLASDAAYLREQLNKAAQHFLPPQVILDTLPQQLMPPQIRMDAQLKKVLPPHVRLDVRLQKLLPPQIRMDAPPQHVLPPQIRCSALARRKLGLDRKLFARKLRKSSMRKTLHSKFAAVAGSCRKKSRGVANSKAWSQAGGWKAPFDVVISREFAVARLLEVSLKSC